jgi:hypothetical protein
MGLKALENTKPYINDQLYSIFPITLFMDDGDNILQYLHFKKEDVKLFRMFTVKNLNFSLYNFIDLR